MGDARGGLQRLPSAADDQPVVEVALLALGDTTAQAFAHVLRGAITHLRRAPGYLAHSCGPCADEAELFLLLVWWRSIDAHVVDFRQSEDHVLWRSLLQGHLRSEPWVRHFEVNVGIDQEN